MQISGRNEKYKNLPTDINTKNKVKKEKETGKSCRKS